MGDKTILIIFFIILTLIIFILLIIPLIKLSEKTIECYEMKKNIISCSITSLISEISDLDEEINNKIKELKGGKKANG